MKLDLFRMSAIGIAAVMLAAIPVQAADFEQAMDYYKSGKHLESAAAFQALVDEAPTYDYGHFMLGLSLVKIGKPADAEASFLKAIENNGDRFEYHHALAKSYYDRGEYKKSASTLNTAESLAGDEPARKYALYSLRGYAEAEQKQWSDAIEDLEKAKAIKPNVTIMTQLGKAYFSLRHSDKAVAAFRESLKYDANNAEIHKLLANSLLNMGAESRDDGQKKRYYGEAMASAQKFASLRPGSGDAHSLVGRAALGAGEYREAVTAFSEALSAKPDNCNLMANMGKALIALEDWDNALQSMDNAAKCDRSMRVAWDSLGFVLQKMASAANSKSKYEEAIAAYEKAMELKSTSSTQQKIDTCLKNIGVIDDNKAMDAEEIAQQQAIEAEKARQAEEERKRAEWKKKQEDQ